MVSIPLVKDGWVLISDATTTIQLSADGKLALVQPMIDAITDLKVRELVQIYWDDSTDFDRDHPTLIQFAYGLGLTDEELDIMFINANKR